MLTSQRRRAIVATALAIVASGCSGSSSAPREASAHYVDAAGDGGRLPDIRAIDVTSTRNGRISFRVRLGNLAPRSETAIDFWLDTDADPETGNTTFQGADGADYMLSALLGFEPSVNDAAFCSPIRGGNGCFARWTPSGWIGAKAATATVSRSRGGVTLSIDRRDLASTQEFNFFVVRGAGPPAFPDRAPGDGTFRYSLARGGPRAEASTQPSERADKAGGKRQARRVTLTLANHDYPATDTAPAEFAAAVERLSGGSVRIDVEYGYRFYDVESEQGTIADVRHGVVDIAMVGARAWDAAGVKSFNALVAPFLVDSYALQRRVLESSLPEPMLEGIEPLGLVGLGIIPGELRRPLGISRPLLRPADYRGARVGIRPAGVANATFAALGAHAEGFPSNPGGLVTFDGAESGLNSINNNVYDLRARALTANVVLWPRATTIFMNRKSFDALTSDQQAALRDAGAEAVPPLLETLEKSEEAALAAICRRGHLRLRAASPADRRALRQAVQPVYRKLERHALTRDLIDEIENLRRAAGEGAEPLRCPTAGRGGAPSALDGTWRTKVSREDLRAAGAQVEQFERAEGSWTVEFHDGRWVARNRASGNVYRGTYAVERDVVRETVLSCSPANICIRGSAAEYRWSVYRDKLQLTPIPGRAFDVGLVAKPLTRVR